MRVKSINLRGFKRYTETLIDGIPQSARLVVLAGPNGSGKSSIFDGMRTWHAANGSTNMSWDESYGHKVGTPDILWPDHIQVEFHEEMPAGSDGRKKLIYIRSAFRNEADFQINNFSRLASPLESPRIQRLIDNDVSVSDNYQRLVMQTIDGIYDDSIPDSTTKGDIRDRIIGEVQRAMEKVFPDLVLTGIGGIGSSSEKGEGTFYFNKGASKNFLFKNLSAGEKAAFDLLLDAVTKREFYDDSIWCIDEPETHLNTRVQGLLLQALVELLPQDCQLWIASHSIGFMRKAWDMAKADPNSVSFLDLQGIDFDQRAIIKPIAPDRQFWTRTLEVALGDLASLVAPESVVLCEGRPAKTGIDQKAEFDAACYRKIFAKEFADTDFLSVGNSLDAGADRLEIGRTIQTLASGTKIIRLIDRDMRSDEEVEALLRQNIRVLSRRHLESYLLDAEVIASLCINYGHPDKVDQAIQTMREELESSQQRGNDADDLKSACGTFYTRVRQLLSLTQAGGTVDAFKRDTLAPLIQPGMQVYTELRRDIFGY